MKRTPKLCAICMIAIFGSKGTYAQYTSTPEPPAYSVASSSGATLNQIIDTMYAHADPTDTGEGGELDRIKSFKTFWQNRVVANDGSGVNMFDQYYGAVSTSAGARLTAGMVGCDGKWSCIGVNDVPYQVSGYVSSVWANPADSNHILATSHGGIFKTTNGGTTWQCITDNAALSGPTMNIYWMAINPSNPNTILAGSLGGGIIKTFDGGANWQQENITVPRENIRKVFYTPDSIRIYAFKGDTVFTRLSADGSPWYNITPSGVTAVWRNLQFVPGDRTHFFISSEGTNTGVWETTDSMGSTWTKITNGFSDVVSGATISATGWRVMDISVPGNDTLYFIARASAYQTGLYKWNITGGTHTITEIYDNLPGGVNPGVAMGFVVSPSNANNIYYGSDLPFQAYDRSSGFTQIGQYYGNPTHGDIRGMWLQHSTSAANGTGDRIYFATDGGVSIKPTGVSPTTSGALTTKDISGSGLNCGTFWSFATHEADAGIGGMMHDGVVTYEPTQTDKWKAMVWTGDLPGADSWGAEIDKSKPKRGWAWVWSNVLRITSPSGGREMGALSSHVQPSTDPGYPGIAKTVVSDAYGSLYCTGNDFWRKRTTDGAFVNMSVIHGWGFPDRFVTHDTLIGYSIVLDYNDTTFNGYVIYNNTKQIFYRNPHLIGYATAIQIPNPDSPYKYPVNWIATDPSNTERIWTTHTGQLPDTATFERYKVHYSDNHGNTWVDISLGLPLRLPIGKILFDDGANTLYCTNDMGIFKCEMNSYNPADTISISPGHIQNRSVSWTCFNKGEVTEKNFPMMQATDL